MISLILPKIHATIDELILCRLSRKEQKRVAKLLRGVTRVGIVLSTTKNHLRRNATIYEIRKMIRHTEVWVEESRTAVTHQHLMDLLSYFDELELIVQRELENRHLISHISNVLKSLASLLF